MGTVYRGRRLAGGMTEGRPWIIEDRSGEEYYEISSAAKIKYYEIIRDK